MACGARAVTALVLAAGMLVVAHGPLAAAASSAAPGSVPGEAAPRLTDDARVIFITGSTDGLGREVALRLAATGAHVIVHGRNVDRGEAVVRQIEEAGVGSARFYRADLANYSEVRDLAAAVLRDYDRLDVLVNNAGIWLQPEAGRLVNDDGHELHFAVNYLSTFLLTHLLMPRLKESAPSRIVNVASLAASPIDFDDVMMERGYTDSRGYGQSKLAQVFFTLDLAGDLDGTGVTVYALHPASMMDTNMVLSRGAPTRSSVEDGVEAVLNLVLSNDVEHGGFYNGLRPARANAQAYDEDARERLRVLSRELTGL